MKSQWTCEQIRAARQTPLAPVLEGIGYRLSPTGRDNYLVVGLPGEIVVKDHYWVRMEDGVAGNAIDFFVRLQGKSFGQAMRLLSDRAAHVELRPA